MIKIFIPPSLYIFYHIDVRFTWNSDKYFNDMNDYKIKLKHYLSFQFSIPSFLGSLLSDGQVSSYKQVSDRNKNKEKINIMSQRNIFPF